MNYQDWLKIVPKEITEDTLWRMEVYRFSLFAGDLAETVSNHRIQLHTQIIRHLLKIIPAERGYKLSEESAPYYVETRNPDELLENVPMLV